MWCYVTEDRARAEAVFADVLAPMLNRPVEELRAILPIGPAEECAEKLLAYARAGAQRVFLWPLVDERAHWSCSASASCRYSTVSRRSFSSTIEAATHANPS